MMDCLDSFDCSTFGDRFILLPPSRDFSSVTQSTQSQQSQASGACESCEVLSFCAPEVEREKNDTPEQRFAGCHTGSAHVTLLNDF